MKFYAVILSTMGLASAAVNPAGFYVAGQIGYGALHGKSVHENQSTNAGFAWDSTKSNALVQAIVGCNMAVFSVVLGVELHAAYDNVKIMNRKFAGLSNSGFNDIIYELQNSRGVYGMATRLGYFISSSTMAFVRFSGEYRKYKLSILQVGTTVARRNVWDSTRKSRICFAPGFGLETWLNNNVSIRADWKYIVGQRITLVSPAMHVTGQVYDIDNSITKIKLRGQSFMVGAAYKF